MKNIYVDILYLHAYIMFYLLYPRYIWDTFLIPANAKPFEWLFIETKQEDIFIFNNLQLFRWGSISEKSPQYCSDPGAHLTKLIFNFFVQFLIAVGWRERKVLV